MDLQSALLVGLFQNDDIVVPALESLQFKENFLNGISLVDSNGNVLAEAMANAGGGFTITDANGETATVTETVTGGIFIDNPGIHNDITSMPSIFNQENFFQNGELIGTMQPNFMGNGFDFTSPTGLSFSTTPDALGNTQVDISTPFIEPSFGTQTFDLQNSFSEIDTISSQFSATDIGSVTDAMDGLDVLGFF